MFAQGEFVNQVISGYLSDCHRITFYKLIVELFIMHTMHELYMDEVACSTFCGDVA